MLNTMNIIEIMRLTDAVYECKDLENEQDFASFKEIKDPMNPKRYVRFVCNYPHSKYQSALTNHLENIGDGDAVIKKRVVEKDGKYILSDRGFRSVTLVDMSKVTNYDEMLAMQQLIENTVQKMQLSKTEAKLAATKSMATKLKSGIKKINELAEKTKSGLGSRNVNALKQVIAETAENTK